MRFHFSFLFLLIVTPAVAQVAIPDTPAGHVLKDWLQSWNSGNRDRLAEFYQLYGPERRTVDADKLLIDRLMSQRDKTGPYEFLGITESKPRRVVFLIRWGNSDLRAVAKMEVTESEPVRLSSLIIHDLDVLPGTPDSTITFSIDATTRDSVIDSVINRLNESYLVPAVAKQMGSSLREHQKRGDYDSVTDGDDFANLLSSQLRPLDAQLRVRYNPVPLDKWYDQDLIRNALLKENCGFQRMDVLPSNVGYLKLNRFADSTLCGPTAIAAMNFLGNTDALILDLRESGGTDAKMIALISTFLFSGLTHLDNLRSRTSDPAEERWTLSEVPGKRLDVPVYLLTSKRTVAGAEEFSYDLQQLKRASIVGETTGGSAYVSDTFRVGDHFAMDVPVAEPVNPITKKNWERDGVSPDVKVAAGDALTAAEKMAHEALGLK